MYRSAVRGCLYKYTHELARHAMKAGLIVLYLDRAVTNQDDGAMVKTILGSLALSKRLRRTLCEQGRICVNGAPAYLTNRVRVGDRVTVEAPEEFSSAIEPEPIPLHVVFEDEHLLAVDKQAGLIVHPTAHERQGTLASAVIHHMRQRGESYPFRPVHRLDRATSGLLLVAKHKLAHERLSRSLKTRAISRQYTAFASGAMDWREERTIDAAIGLLPGTCIKRAVYPYGKAAITHLRVERVYAQSGAVKLLIGLETGRTHQIRVHLAYIGHPVLGDSMYGFPAMNEKFSVVLPDGRSRHALHAHQLTFAHPVTNQAITLCAPLPPELQRLAAALAKGVHG